MNNLSIYPNPVNDILYINLDKTRLLNKALVINANGTVLITRDILTDESFSVDMSGLSQGVYLLQLQGDGFVEVHKIIKK